LNFGKLPGSVGIETFDKDGDYQTENGGRHRFLVGAANFLCHSHKKMPDLEMLDLEMLDLEMPGSRKRSSGHDQPFGTREAKA
jgi:hypothetical protein